RHQIQPARLVFRPSIQTPESWALNTRPPPSSWSTAITDMSTSQGTYILPDAAQAELLPAVMASRVPLTPITEAFKSPPSVSSRLSGEIRIMERSRSLLSSLTSAARLGLLHLTLQGM